MSAPTEEEKLLIPLFRERVSNVLHTEYTKSDPFLLRWLRARDWNLEKAEAMLRTSFKWREEKNIDSVLLKESSEFCATNYPYNLDDVVDRDGRPVVLLQIGKWDFRKSVEAGKSEEFVEYTNQMFEKLIVLINKSKCKSPDWPHTQFCALADWTGFSFSQLANMKAVQNILQLASTYEAHYPEIIHRLIFFNCTYVFSLLFKLMRPMLATKTLGKITIVGTSREKWEKEILELVDPEQIPPEFGGTNSKTQMFKTV